MKGSIQVKDINGATASTMEISGAPDLASMVSLATGIQSYMRGQIMQVSMTETQMMDLPAASTGPYALANQKAVLTFRDLDATGSKGPSLIVRMPCPNEIMFQAGDNGDFIVIPAQGAALASMINARLGRNVEFSHGILWNKARKRR